MVELVILGRMSSLSARNFSDGGADIIHLFERHLRKQAAGSKRFGGPLGVRKSSFWISQRDVGWLQMERPGIVDQGINSAFGEFGLHAATIADENDEQVVDALILRIVLWQSDAHFGEQPAVFLSELAAFGGPIGQAAHFDLQNRALKSFHAVIVADEFVFVAPGLAVVASGPGEVRNARVVGDDRAAFSISAQVLGGIKAEGSDIPDGAHAAATIAGAVSLAGVFNHRDTAGFGDGEDGVHIRGPAIKMNGHDGFCLGGDGAVQKFGIEIGCGRINIDKNRFCAGVGDGFGGSQESAWAW